MLMELELCVPDRLKSDSSVEKSGFASLLPFATSTFSVTVSPSCIALRSSHARTSAPCAQTLAVISHSATIRAQHRIRALIVRRLLAAARSVAADVRVKIFCAVNRPDRPARAATTAVRLAVVRFASLPAHWRRAGSVWSSADLCHRLVSRPGLCLRCSVAATADRLPSRQLAVVRPCRRRGRSAHRRIRFATADLSCRNSDRPAGSVDSFSSPDPNRRTTTIDPTVLFAYPRPALPTNRRLADPCLDGPSNPLCSCRCLCRPAAYFAAASSAIPRLLSCSPRHRPATDRVAAHRRTQQWLL